MSRPQSSNQLSGYPPPKPASIPQAHSQIEALVARFEPILKHINLHRFLWLFTLICALIAWNRGLMLLYALVAFLLAIILISYLYYGINLSGLKIQAALPIDNVVAGDNVAISVQLSSRLTQHFLSIQLLLERVYQDEPLGTANAATLASRGRKQGQNLHLFVIQSKGTQTFDCKAVLPRGVYQLPRAQLQSAYPLGIITKQRMIALSSHRDDLTKLYVLPTSFTISHLPAHQGNSTGQGQLKSSHSGAHDEVSDIRRYHRGDAFKTIHWGASARQASRGKDWMVKQFEALDKPQAIIFLNQLVTRATSERISKSERSFDTMVTLALSFAQHLSAQNYEVTVVGFDAPLSSLGEYWQLHLPPHTAPTSDNLRKLAEIDYVLVPDHLIPSATYSAFVQQVLAKYSPSVIVQFFHHSAMSTASALDAHGLSSAHASQQHQIYLSEDYQSNHYRAAQPPIIQYEINPASSILELQALFNQLSGSVLSSAPLTTRDASNKPNHTRPLS